MVTWMLKDEPTAKKLALLVKRNVITANEAREILEGKYMNPFTCRCGYDAKNKADLKAHWSLEHE